MPAKRIHNDTAHKKYNLRSKPTMVAKDDDNDDENDDDTNVLISSKNVAFSA